MAFRPVSWLGVGFFFGVVSVLWIAEPESSAQTAQGTSTPPPPSPSKSPETGKTPTPSRSLLDMVRLKVQKLEEESKAKREEVERHQEDVTLAPADRVKKAEADFRQSVLDRELAEILLGEYELGISVQEVETLKGEITLAMADLDRAEERFKESEDMLKLGKIKESEFFRESLSRERAVYSHELAMTKLAVLENFTRQKEIDRLRGEINRLREAEFIAKREWDRARQTEQFWRKRSALKELMGSEAHIEALLGEAGVLQAKVVTILEPISSTKKKSDLTPEQTKKEAETVQSTLEEARKLESEAGAKVTEALKLAGLVQAWRDEIRDVESRLYKARAELKILEKAAEKR